LDNLAVALCISIGTGVPWLIAVYSDNGARQLIGNTVFGMVGTAFATSAFNWIFSENGIAALVSLGPAVAFLTIAAGQAAKRAILPDCRGRRIAWFPVTGKRRAGISRRPSHEPGAARA
jgi:hypothetical protein